MPAAHIPTLKPRAASDRVTLKSLAGLFLKLGTTAFGGPAAHIAMMEDEVVRRRNWLTREEFLDLVGAANLLPGPSSTELAIYIGYSRAGWRGLVLAGTCFILPAMLMVGTLAVLYVRFGSLPEVTGVLYGIKPVVIAVVLQALWGFGRASIKSWVLSVVGIAAACATIIGASQLLVLASAGLAVMMYRGVARAGGAFAGAQLIAPGSAWRPRRAVTTGAVAASAATTSAFGLWPLFLVFLKVGAVLFGSGYVLLAFLRADLVQHLGWLSERQLLDAVAVGQITPGPVFTTATFIGYVLGGTRGALVATVGIFLPSFLLVAVSGPLLPRLQASPMARAFLDGVIVASLALMAVVTWHLSRAALIDLPTVLLAVLSLTLLLRFRVNSSWLVLAGAVVGLALQVLPH
jgi:chromate transporter